MSNHQPKNTFNNMAAPEPSDRTRARPEHANATEAQENDL